MDSSTRVLAVIPARGGSKGLPGKNLLPVGGLPLIAHSIRLARSIPAVQRCIVSTDDDDIAAVAARFGAEVPFRRPAALSGDDVAMAPVLRHALEQVEAAGERYDLVVLLMPTCPIRRSGDLTAALDVLLGSDADGVVSVSEPPFNPLWVGVHETADGALERYFAEGAGIVRRQDARRFLRINGVYYVWRAEFVRRLENSWFDEGRHLGVETDDASALDVDTAADYERLCRLVDAGLVELPSP